MSGRGIAAVAAADDLGAFHLGHDLPHLHSLAGRHFVNPDDDLIVGSVRRGLQEFPQTLDESPLVLYRATRSDE